MLCVTRFALRTRSPPRKRAPHRYWDANARLDELLRTEHGDASASLHEARKITQGAYLYARLHRAASARGHAGEEGPTLGDGLAFVHAYRQLMSQSGIVPTARKLGATAASARALASLNVFTLLAPTLHPCSTLEGGYAFDDDFGVDGANLRELVSWYDHGAHHATFKGVNARDVLSTGVGGAALLLRFGDLDAAQADWSRASANWAALLARLGDGAQRWRPYRIDLLDTRAARAVAISTGRFGAARALFESSPEGLLYRAHQEVHDASQLEAAAAELEAHVRALDDYLSHWGMPCTWSTGAFELMSRAVGTLLQPNHGDAEGWAGCGDADAPLAAPRWLPAPAALLKLAAKETAWDVFVVGAQHPSLAAALVHAQLGRWAEAREVATGLLSLLHQPLSRFEAHRLLARCAAAGDGSAALRSAAVDEALRDARAEAVASGYRGLEQMIEEEL